MFKIIKEILNEKVVAVLIIQKEVVLITVSQD